MKTFKLAQPQTLEQVTTLPAGEIYFLMAGGTDLLDEIKNEIIAPDIVVDLKTIPNLDYIENTKKGVRIGALTTVSELAENQIIRQNFPVLHQAALSLATPQLRNMGTVGGNLCQRPRCWYYRDPQVKCRKKGGNRCYAFKGRNRYHAILGGGICYIVHPSDLAPALISLDAEVTIAKAKGETPIPLADFFALPRDNVRKENILEPGEAVKEIRLPPLKPGSRSTYFKFKERGTWDFAVVSAAVTGVISRGIFEDIRIVMGGIAPIPWRLDKAEQIIKGNKATEELARKGVREALAGATPLEENTYKKDLAEVVVSRTVMSLIQ
ncbi:MAG: xanthine dehydrogenase family protein subunit M [Candidatus Aminicenantes bacterium]|nr:xanthine dehydrogenase family protein subunit M [Candidatus Aminicenantes bacterium]